MIELIEQAGSNFPSRRFAAGTVDGISDWDAVRHDYDEEEKKTYLVERYASTNTTFFKILLCLIFGGTGLAQLYVIYLA